MIKFDNSQYLTTKKMAFYLGYSSDYLLNNRGLIFFEGVHYFPKDKRIDWKVSTMVSWVENQSINSQVQSILQRLIK